LVGSVIISLKKTECEHYNDILSAIDQTTILAFEIFVEFKVHVLQLKLSKLNPE
jgi:hypothetical protein